MPVNIKQEMEKSKGKKKLRSIDIERGKSGGYVMNHRFENSGGMGHYHESETHVAKSDTEMMKHVKEHLCGASE